MGIGDGYMVPSGMLRVGTKQTPVLVFAAQGRKGGPSRAENVFLARDDSDRII